MKKIAAIFLLSLYIFGSTDACQLLKLPKFIAHFRTHRQQNESLTLAAFLQIHYNNGPLVIDDDFDQDMQLPFKTTQVNFNNSVNIIVPNTVAADWLSPVFSGPEFLISDQSVPDLFDGRTVFQPPRHTAFHL